MSRLSGRFCRLCLSHRTYAQAQQHITRSGSAVNSVGGVSARVPVRWKNNSAGGGDDKNKKISSIVQPVDVKPFNNPDDISVGVELTGELKKDDLLKLLNKFYRQPEVKQLAAESGLDNRLFHQAYVGFRRFCVESEALPVDLHIVFSDILQDAGHVDDVFPYFLRHAKEMFPHLDCMDDLRKISDLRLPANWYPEARGIQRKIIYHAGPTNSGKTHHALQRFLTAKSGVYCGPLRLLANEVFHKANAAGTPCDLVTGEERRFVGGDGEPSDHVSCTVEMTSVTTPYEVAVIDEIQMVRDQQRGWAWTRTLLGVCAEEVHICGEPSGIDLVKELLYVTGDTLEVRKYKRLTSLTVLDHAIERFEHVKPGDCIVCFSKNDIYHVSRQLEMRGHQCAVIYGTLPPGTKVAQAQKFNDPDSSCKIMVSTDAIGMGLNLNIKRIIFYSLMKPTMNDKGEMEIDVIPVPMALQIAGRAGRYGTQFEEGEVTTFRGADLPMLKKLLRSKVEPIEQAGLHPTAEQIELFAYHLPKATLSNLIDIFVTLSQLDNSLYFMCNVDDFKYLADMIEHISLPLRTRYVFCCAPISKKHPFTCSVFLKFARQFSRGEPLTQEWLCRQLSWPFQAPRTIEDLVHLEGVFDVLDLYLWLSYRFQDMFPHPDDVRDMQKELDEIIQLGVYNITKLLRSQEAKQPIPLEEEEPKGEEVGGEKSLYATLSQDQEAGLPKRPLSLLEQFQNARKNMNTSAYDSRLKKDDTGFRRQRGKKLMDQLVDQGILTEEMLQKLQKEFHESDNNNNNNDNRGKSPKHRGRRR